MESREPKVINSTFFKPVQTARDWKKIEEMLSILHPIRFIIDDYNVKMHMVEHKIKLVIVLFINGEYDHKKWKDTEIPEKFYQKKESYLHNKKARDLVTKQIGKKKAQEAGLFAKGTYMQYYWTSFRSLQRHLGKTCKEIMVCKADLHRTIGDLFTEYKNV